MTMFDLHIYFKYFYLDEILSWEDRKMRNICLKKGLVVGIIVLFLGISIVPGITADNLLKDTQTEVTNNELVDITVQVCRIDSIENHEVTLTRNQLAELDDLINNIRLELDNIETREDIVEIYVDAILSMDKLGLLPEDMSIEDAQQLLIDNTNKFMNVNDKEIYNQNPSSTLENRFCYVTGIASRCGYPLGGEIIFPYRIFWLLCFGMAYIDPDFYYHYFPSEGWVSTIGMYGIGKMEGRFIGTLGEIPTFTFMHKKWLYLGARGYTGFCIWFGDKTIILGFATVIQLAYFYADSGDNVELQPMNQKINLHNNYDNSQGGKQFFNQLLLRFIVRLPFLERLLNILRWNIV